MKLLFAAILLSLPLVTSAMADTAVDVIGDYTFPKAIIDMPVKLSDFKGLQINSFNSNDGIRLNYWEAGSGDPIVFVPAWGASGADLFNELWLLSKTNHVYVLDPRNQGTSDRTLKGQRIARYAMDLNEFLDHIGVEKTVLAGWSMGVSVIWSYIDLFGTDRISKAIFVDEPVSIYTHANWSEQERLNAGGMTTSAERMIEAYRGAPTNQQVVDMKVVQRSQMVDSPYAQNALGLAHQMAADPAFSMLVLFDHATNDWSDVIQHKLDIPVAVFSGEQSNNFPSQKWIVDTAPDGRLFNYGSGDDGDHFLMLKNPVRFVKDLRAFVAE
jgi:non-heme chloroperoxidase